MSLDIYVYLNPKLMPTPTQWQEAILKHGFELKIDTDFDLLSLTGFLPCTYGEREAGFEYFYEVLDSKTLLKKGIPQEKTSLITLVTHSDEWEALSSAIASAALAALTDGTLEDPQEGKKYSGVEAVLWAKNVEREILANSKSGVDPNVQKISGTPRKAGCLGVIVFVGLVLSAATALAYCR